jgi:hypothetical protein
VPVTFFLSLYLIPSVINLDKDLINLIPVTILLILIYLVNKRYLFLYEVVPYKIFADDEKLVCKNFFLSRKERVIYFKDIDKLEGGVFSGKIKGLMKVYDGKTKICIGFFDKMKGVQTLQTIILSKVSADVYNKVVESVGIRKKQ